MSQIQGENDEEACTKFLRDLYVSKVQYLNDIAWITYIEYVPLVTSIKISILLGSINGRIFAKGHCWLGKG